MPTPAPASSAAGSSPGRPAISAAVAAARQVTRGEEFTAGRHRRFGGVALASNGARPWQAELTAEPIARALRDIPVHVKEAATLDDTAEPEG
jgi:hypothetical protein